MRKDRLRKSLKDFKVAHIVPVRQLGDTSDNQYHMCLAHLVDNHDYRNFYCDMVKKGRYVLMDNGAAEGAQLQPEKLIEMYRLINPTEIVLPDTLYEMGSTIQKSRNFLNRLEKIDMIDKHRIMAVPQGRTLEEWSACARIFMKDTRINTIGVSKFLTICTNDRYVRMAACNVIKELMIEYDRVDIEVHLLGCDEGPLGIKMCQELYPFVRGCDSAFAYLQAQAKKMMTLNDDSRPEGTIDFIDGKEQNEFVKYMNNFNEFAGAEDNGQSSNW